MVLNRILGMMAALLLLIPMTANANLVSTFDTDAGGWSVAGDARDFKWTVGSQGTYVEATDRSTGATWYFVAPSPWHGNLTPYIGGTLEYDIFLFTNSTNYYSTDEVVIFSGTDKAFWNASANPTYNIWTHYEVDLIASNFEISGTKSFAEILQDVTALHIRGEYISGGDKEGLDNVRLSAVPVPAALLLLGSGLICLAGVRRRFKK